MRVYVPAMAGLVLVCGLSPLQAQPIDATAGYQPVYSYAPPPPDEAPPPPLLGSQVVGLRGSLALPTSTTSPLPSVPTTIRSSYNTGGGGSVYIGQRLGYGLRLDLEGVYRYLPFSHTTQAGFTTPGTGSAQLEAPMVNLMWEMPPTDWWGITGIVGMGVGGAYTDIDLKDAAGTTKLFDSKKWALAYDVMAGLEMPFSDNGRITAMYRWMRVDDSGPRCPANAGLSNPCSTPLTNSGVDLGMEMDL